ncbi:hypothetical protein KY334_01805, partial [Candidatus Woesearchaeota archaeon]|nr:hypothetical protein [Candidatus Woesearchaeota archaeon]
MNRIKKLTMLLSIPSLDGTVALAAMRGMFTLSNVFVIAFLFMSGPIALLTASSLNGEIKERIIVALISGLIATALIILSAGFGPKILGFLNL